MKSTNTKANANANTRKNAKAQADKGAKAHKDATPKVLKVKMTLNEEHNGVELQFNEKPSVEVRKSLKGLGFRWHSTKQVWYAKQSADTMAFAKMLDKSEGLIENAVKDAPKPKASKSKKDAPKVKADKVEAPKVEQKELGYSGAVKTSKGTPTKALIKALNEAEGLTAEMDRTWLWVTGDTRAYKESLKALGFHFSGKREAWYLMA